MSHSSSESGSDSEEEEDHSRSATPAYPNYSPHHQQPVHNPEPTPDNSDEDDEDEDDDDNSDDDDDDSDHESDVASIVPTAQPVPIARHQSEVSLPLPTYNFTKQNPRPPLQAPQAQGLMRVLVGHELKKAGFETADEDALDALAGAVDERESIRAEAWLPRPT